MTVEKDRYAVILLLSTSHALRAEMILVRAGVPNKLIPVPRQLSSDCGVCLRVDRIDCHTAEQALAQAGLETQGICDI